MSEDYARRRTPGLFIPFTLLAAAVLFSLIWQILSTQSQYAVLKSTKAQLVDTIQKRAPQVAQAEEIKKRLEALASDLLELSKTDPAAQAIVKKHGIERALPAAVAGAGGK